jgi:tetratricopeptide (TPR) repeat protein/DNA-binding winged helix-turn-helix (wHTH) protein
MPPTIFRFLTFELRTRTRELYKHGIRLKLRHQPFQVLSELLSRPGELVSREELRQKLWSSETFVDFEQSLNTSIKELRAVLGDSATAPKFIETVPRLGYRFIAPVEAVEPPTVKSDAPTPAVEAEAPAVSPASGRGWSWLRVAGYVVVALALAGGGLYYWLQRSRGQSSTAGGFRPRQSVAVLGFKNQTGSPESEWVSTALAEMFGTELAAGQRVRIIPGEDVYRARVDLPIQSVDSLGPSTLKRLHDRLDADYVLLGSYALVGQGQGRRVRLDLLLQDASDGGTIEALSKTGTETDLFDLVSQAGIELRRKLGESELDPSLTAQVNNSYPNDPEAARLYADALVKMRSYEARDARDLLERVVEIEPKNAKAHAALARTLNLLGYEPKALEEARKAFELAGGLSRDDQLWIEGGYRELQHDAQRAMEVYHTLWNFFPDRLDYGIAFANQQIAVGSGKDALATIATLHQLFPGAREDPRLDVVEAQAAYSTGDFKHDLQASRRAVQIASNLGMPLIAARGHYLESIALERLGNKQESQQALKLASDLYLHSGDMRSAANAYLMAGHLLYDAGDYTGARGQFDKGLEIATQIGAQGSMRSALENIGNIYYEQNDLLTAKEYYTRTLKIDQERGDKRNIASSLGNLANVYQGLGDLEAARNSHEQALVLFQDVGDRRGAASTGDNLGNLFLQMGDLPRSRKSFDQALVLDEQTGYRRGRAYCLTGLGDLLLTQGQMQDAQAKFQEAMDIAKELNEAGVLAIAQTEMAGLLLEQEDAKQALELARKSAAEFEKESDSGNAATTHALIARILLTQGNIDEAGHAAATASTYAQKTADFTVQLETRMAQARFEASSGKAPAAIAAIQTVIADAHKRGFLGYEYEARMALGEFEFAHGNRAQGVQALNALQQEARSKGFLLIARKAESAMRG